MRSAGIDPAAFVQDSLSRSRRGVVRGMHVRSGKGEAKLVRCSYGAIFDVIVDLRPASPTYRNWESFELRDDEQVSLYVRPAARTASRPSPTQRMCPIGSTAHMTRLKTCRSRSMIPSWAYHGRFPPPPCHSETGRLTRWAPRRRCSLSEALTSGHRSRDRLAAPVQDQRLEQRPPLVRKLVGPAAQRQRSCDHVNLAVEAAPHYDASACVLLTCGYQDH